MPVATRPDTLLLPEEEVQSILRRMCAAAGMGGLLVDVSGETLLTQDRPKAETDGSLSPAAPGPGLDALLPISARWMAGPTPILQAAGSPMYCAGMAVFADRQHLASLYLGPFELASPETPADPQPHHDQVPLLDEAGVERLFGLLELSTSLLAEKALRVAGEWQTRLQLAQIRESEHRYRTLFEGANDAILIIEDNRIVNCNQQALRMFRRSREELIGASLFNLSPPLQPNGQLSALLSEISNIEARQGGPHVYSWNFTLPDQSIFEAEVSLNCFEMEGHVLLQAILRDQTERNRSRRLLEEREAAWRAIIHHAPFGIAINRLEDGVYLDVNPALEQFSGRQAREMIGMTPLDFAPPAERAEISRAWEILRREGRIDQGEALVARKDGSAGHVLYSTAVFHSGQVPCTVSMVVDITERRRTEERLRQSEAKLKSLFEAVPVGLAILKDRVFLSVNEQFSRIIGYAQSELIGRNSRFLYGSQEEFLRVGAALYENQCNGKTGYAESLFLRPDGTGRLVALFSAPLEPDNPAAGAAVAIQDITEQRQAEDSLRLSEQRLAVAVAASSDAIWEWNPNSGGAYFSPRWYEMLGIEDRQFPKDFSNWKELCHPDDLQVIRVTLKHVMATMEDIGFTIEFRMRHALGNWVWILCRGKVIHRDAEGAPLLLAGTCINITKRKLAELALKENEKRYKTLFEASENAIFLLKDGLISECNTKALEMFRCQRQELIGLSPGDISPPHQTDGRTFAEKGAELFSQAQNNGSSQFEWLHTRLDGEHFFAEVSLSVLDLAEERLIQAIVHDITQRKLSEKALRESEFRFRSFYDNNPQGIILMDFKGMILDANKAFLSSSGYQVGDLVHRSFQDFIPDEFHGRIIEVIVQRRAGLSSTEGTQISYRNKADRLVPILARSWLVMDEESRPLYLGVFIHDLSKEMILAEEKALLEKQVIQAQKSEAIGTLAGGIAHDFNNILGGIIGYAELALHRDPSLLHPTTAEYLQRVLEAGNRAKNLVQQILRFSRNHGAAVEPICLTPLIKESIHLLRSTLPTTIEIRQQIETTRDRILGDPTQIHQVVMNLATNAYHAMRDRGGVITFSLANDHLQEARHCLSMTIPPGDYLRLEVTDTGCGMTPAVLDRIFEPYFTTKEINEGTGLGMAVAQGIVKSHKGLIEVESEPGRGTCFRVFLPLTGKSTGEKMKKARQLPLGNGQRVLIVDDEPFFLEVVQESLRLLGYQVTAGRTSPATLEIFRNDPNGFDLLVTDQTMPEMTGVQLTREVRKLNSSIPVILCTGFSETVTEESASYYGITGFLMKPVNIHDLARSVASVLAGKTLP